MFDFTENDFEHDTSLLDDLLSDDSAFTDTADDSAVFCIF